MSTCNLCGTWTDDKHDVTIACPGCIDTMNTMDKCNIVFSGLMAAAENSDRTPAEQKLMAQVILAVLNGAKEIFKAVRK